LKLELAGTDMQLLLPLIGIAFPKTPSYQIKGDLDYADGRIRFRNFTGQLGSSDVEGNIEVDPGQKRPVVTADVSSRQIDLADLGGFLGSEPGRMNTPNQTPEQHQAVARAEASPRLLPTTTISLPKLLAADVHLKYRGARIQGRNMPFDSVAADMDIVDGRILLHPVSIGVGQGQIAGTVELAPLNGEQFHTKADIAVQRVDLGRMLKATNMVGGSGMIGGHAVLETIGNSTATMLANGNGSLQLTMAGGGDLSALLVALSGLQFGNALLSALGIPDRDRIECFVADFVLQRGELQTRALLLDTTSDITSGSGAINLRAETLNYQIKTEAKHFTIGALPAPISITGSFKDPGALPDISKLAVRGGVAAGLGVLFPPAAILPTIQFGVGDDHRCEALAHRGK
jgi:AsmA family protein